MGTASMAENFFFSAVINPENEKIFKLRPQPWLKNKPQSNFDLKSQSNSVFKLQFVFDLKLHQNCLSISLSYFG